MSSISGMGGPRAQVDADRIAAAALSLFAERGYRATTMADIGAAVGVRGPSLYKHVSSKQELLSGIMRTTMAALIDNQHAAHNAGGDPVLCLRRMVEVHVRYHATHRLEAFVGNREIANLEPRNRKKILALRDRYERVLRDVIEEGNRHGQFDVRSVRLTSYAILDMGIGVATWFRPDGDYTADEVAYIYADHALRLVGAA